MKLLFVLLLCVLILSQSARSPSFDIRFHGSSSISYEIFVEPLFFLHFVIVNTYLRWLKTVSSTFQDLDFDVSS